MTEALMAHLKPQGAAWIQCPVWCEEVQPSTFSGSAAPCTAVNEEGRLVEAE